MTQIAKYTGRAICLDVSLTTLVESLPKVCAFPLDLPRTRGKAIKFRNGTIGLTVQDPPTGDRSQDAGYVVRSSSPQAASFPAASPLTRSSSQQLKALHTQFGFRRR